MAKAEDHELKVLVSVAQVPQAPQGLAQGPAVHGPYDPAAQPGVGVAWSRASSPLLKGGW
jgi:hypothetical protein